MVNVVRTCGSGFRFQYTFFLLWRQGGAGLVGYISLVYNPGSGDP